MLAMAIMLALFWQFTQGPDVELELGNGARAIDSSNIEHNDGVVSRTAGASARNPTIATRVQVFDIVVRVSNADGALLPSQLFAQCPQDSIAVPVKQLGRGFFRVIASHEKLTIVATRLDSGDVQTVDFNLQADQREYRIEFPSLTKSPLSLTILGPTGDLFSGLAKLTILDCFDGADRGIQLRRSKGSWRGQGLEASFAKNTDIRDVPVLGGKLVVSRNRDSSTFLRVESAQGSYSSWIPPGKTAHILFLRQDLKSRFKIILDGEPARSGTLELTIGDLKSSLWRAPVTNGKATLTGVPGVFGATFTLRNELDRVVAALPIDTPSLIEEFQSNFAQSELIELRFQSFKEIEWKILQRANIDTVHGSWSLVASIRSPNSVRVEIASFRSEEFDSSIILPLSDEIDGVEFGLRIGRNYIPVEQQEERTIDLGRIYSVSGEVLDENGNPVPYAEVGLADQRSQINKLHTYKDLTVRCSASGHFRLLLGAYSYRMLVRSPKFLDYEARFTVASDMILKPCELTKSMKLRGRLLGPNSSDITSATIVPASGRIMSIQTSRVADSEFEFSPKTRDAWFSISLRNKFGTEFGVGAQFKRNHVAELEVPHYYRHTIQIAGRTQFDRVDCYWRSVKIYDDFAARSRETFDLTVPKANVVGKIRILVDREWVVVWEGLSSSIPDRIALDDPKELKTFQFLGAAQKVGISVCSSANLVKELSLKIEPGEVESARLELSTDDMVVIRVNHGLTYYFAPEDEAFNCAEAGDYDIATSAAVSQWLAENRGSILAVFQDRDHQAKRIRPKIVPEQTKLGLLFPRRLAATISTGRGSKGSYQLRASVDLSNKTVALDFD